MTTTVRAPGRVNLIGDHTDYTGGLVMPMAIDRWTSISFAADERIVLTSRDEPQPADLSAVISASDVAAVEPAWARFVAAVAVELQTHQPGHLLPGIRGDVSTTIPIGAGLSSSAALEVAVALALGYQGDPVSLAQLCRRAEHLACGVPSGIMDQLTITSGVAGHALLMDCHDLTVVPTAVPAAVDVVVQFIAHRRLVGSPYADRVAQCAAAEAVIGPLRLASVTDVTRITDPIVRSRARHVITENERVRAFAVALGAGDLGTAGALMIESHDSLRDDFQISTPAMDEAMITTAGLDGVYGTRMTGGGFGGCLVSICEPGAITDGWIVQAVDGARILSLHERGER
ncbi:MAG: galactokinase family protein [Ilumatobacteraceae bacterium]